jgi:hypothetical protein
MSDGIPIHFFFPSLNHDPIRTQVQKETLRILAVRHLRHIAEKEWQYG